MSIYNPPVVPSWTFIGTQNLPELGDEFVFTDLDAYSQLQIICLSTITDVEDNRGLQVSYDNGATFLNTPGDYGILFDNGESLNRTYIPLLEAAIAPPLFASFSHMIYGLNLASFPSSLSNFGQTGLFFNLTSRVNAIRIFAPAGQIMGSVALFGV